MPELDADSRVFFRNQLRDAHAAAQADAEAFDGVVHAIERLGAYITGGQKTGLGKYEPGLRSLIANADSEQVTAFIRLFESVQDARNDAVHQGAFARRLTRNLVQLAILLEELLSVDLQGVEHFMVEHPVCATPWQQLTLVRQTMLAHAFSYLPVFHGNRWNLVSDSALVRFVRGPSDRRTQKERLQLSLERALERDKDLLTPADVIPMEAPIRQAIELLKGEQPVLVAGSATARHLDGIITLFDLL